jgi:hypothetical protein
MKTHMTSLWAAAIAWVLISAAVPQPIQAQPPWAVSMLRAIAARITVRAPAGTALCHGLVGTTRYGIAYVVTAKHCVNDLSPAAFDYHPYGPRLTGVTITVEFADGEIGTFRTGDYPREVLGARLYGFPSSDVVVIGVPYHRSLASYASECPACQGLDSFAVQGESFPILSLLSSAGGQPVVSTGVARRGPEAIHDAYGDPISHWHVLLPTALGSSGAPVIDLNGNLVGIVSSIAAVRGSEASTLTDLAPGRSVLAQVENAARMVETTNVERDGTVIRMIDGPGGNPVFIVRLDIGWRMELDLTSGPVSQCLPVHVQDRVNILFNGFNGGVLTTLSTVRGTCDVFVMPGMPTP